jgi:cation transport regulator ChaC
MVLLFGYGSLLSPASTALNIKTAKHRRLGVLKGYERVFNLVSVSQIKMNPAHLKTMEVGALSVRPGEGYVVGVLFEIDDEEFPAYKRREARYAIVEVPVEEANGSVSVAWTAVQSSDAEYFRREFGGDSTRQHEEIGQHYSGSLWHNPDVLPSKPYVHVCINGALGMGADVFINLLTARLADGRTTLGQHLLREPMRRIDRTLKGDPLPMTSPVLGPAVDLLARPLIVILAPFECREVVDMTWNSWRRDRHSSHTANMLFVNWSPDWQRFRLEGVLDFIRGCSAVVGGAVVSSPLQAAVFEIACARIDHVSGSATCVEGVYECPPNCYQRPCFATGKCTVGGSSSDGSSSSCVVNLGHDESLCGSKLVVSPACSGRVASIVKYARGFQVACAPATLHDGVGEDLVDPVLLWSLNRVTFSDSERESGGCCAGASSSLSPSEPASVLPSPNSPEPGGCCKQADITERCC